MVALMLRPWLIKTSAMFDMKKFAETVIPHDFSRERSEVYIDNRALDGFLKGLKSSAFLCRARTDAEIVHIAGRGRKKRLLPGNLGGKRPLQAPSGWMKALCRVRTGVYREEEAASTSAALWPPKANDCVSAVLMEYGSASRTNLSAAMGLSRFLQPWVV